MKTYFLLVLFLMSLLVSKAQESKSANKKELKIVDKDSLATKKVMLISTNFNVPMVQYVPLEKPVTKKGDISFFNAVGAGIGFSISDIESALDKNDKVITTDVKNNIGIQTGFLFSSNAGKEGSSNQFAWTVSFIVLDFQVGFGKQLGTIADGQKRNFMNLSYSIPLSKLSKAGSFMLRFKGDNDNFKRIERARFVN